MNQPPDARCASDSRHGLLAPSTWVRRFAGQVPKRGRVLDLACGGGRHTRFFLARGHGVVALDRDVSGLSDLEAEPDLEIVEADLENGSAFPLAGQRFEGVVVTNYLHRPILAVLVDCVVPGGALIYETFARGNERFGRPANPDHLLKPGELLEAVRGKLRVVAYEDRVVRRPWPAAVQRICAVRDA
jgi:SAM-dependent methyltransferase